MTEPFKVLIIGGGIAGLSLALMLEEYGFEYELLEKHADVAPKLGAGVGFTPNGARILDQIGVWDLMCEAGSPINTATAISPKGHKVIQNSYMGELMKKLFGYKIQFISRYDCLNILYNRIQKKSNIHVKQELMKVETFGEKVQVETKDGSIYTGDLLIGADGVRSSVRPELWRIADFEKPGYISKRDKTAIESTYTAVVGVAYDVPGIPRGESVRAYHHHRSYLFQEGREGSGEYYWWLCVKNDKKVKGNNRSLTSEVKEALVDKYKDDKIWPSLTLDDLYKRSVYSAVIPLEEFVLEKCFYKNILLVGDSFRKLHPVAGQGANSAIEECALTADLLWELRERKALHNPASFQRAFSEFQRARYTRLTALRDDANLVQRMESLDNAVLRLVALYIVPKLSFVIAFMPQLGASFAGASIIKHLPSPTMGTWPFAPEIKMKPTKRSSFSTWSWISILLLATSVPWWISKYLPANVQNNNHVDDSIVLLLHALELYYSIITVSISGLWITESYRADSLLSPLSSAIPFILASIYWGWEKILPIYFCLHIKQSQGIYYYYMPPTMTDLGVAKALLASLIVVYIIPVFQSLNDAYGFANYSWKVAHCALPLVAYVSSKFLKTVTTVPSDVEVVFGDMDIPYQRHFHNAVLLVASTLHVFLAFLYGPQLLGGGAGLLSLPTVMKVSSLITLTTTWCLYTAWELRRVNAIDASVVQAWVFILLGTVICGPAATLAGTWSWRVTQLAKARSFQHKVRSMDKTSVGYGRFKLTRLYGVE